MAFLWHLVYYPIKGHEEGNQCLLNKTEVDGVLPFLTVMENMTLVCGGSYADGTYNDKCDAYDMASSKVPFLSCMENKKYLTYFFKETWSHQSTKWFTSLA